MDKTFAGLDSAKEIDGTIVYVTMHEEFVVPEGAEGMVIWQGVETKVRSLGGEESLAQDGRSRLFTCTLIIEPG